MGCGSCSSNKVGLPAGCNNNGSCQTGCGSMLDVYDWLSNVYYVDESVRHQFVEVKFKGTRKGFYQNVNNLSLEVGDKVVVEAHMGGHDLGIVSLVGPLVKVQMRKYKIREDSREIRKVYRLANDNDVGKWRDAKAREYVTMMKSRMYAKELGLEMKISDVEFQGDNTKATFYYTADGRVDFRELIKTLARNFKIKVEMRQIGLRQEAGRLGGIGSCGRELCCSTWLTDFNSVPTTAARYQNLFLNPMKLSGQCGRLKCCLNYELDTYLEALEEFPEQDVYLQTAKGRARVVKTDILKRVMFFVIEGEPAAKLIPIELDDVKELLDKQADGQSVVIEDLEELAIEEAPITEIEMSGDIMADDLDRFDKRQKPRKKKRAKGGGKRKGPNPRNNKNTENKKPSQDTEKQEDKRDKTPKRQAEPGQRNKERGGRGPKGRGGGNRNRKPRNDGQKGGNDKPTS